LPGRHFKRRRQSAVGDTVRRRAGLGAKDHEAILLDPRKVFGSEVAEISLELHTVELGHLIDGTETKTAKSESEINCWNPAASQELLTDPNAAKLKTRQAPGTSLS
jgi:hypothetical protein